MYGRVLIGSAMKLHSGFSPLLLAFRLTLFLDSIKLFHDKQTVNGTRTYILHFFNAESAVPGAYDQLCMNLPLRTIPLRVPTEKSTTLINIQIQQESVGPGKTGLAVWNSALLLGRLLEALALANTDATTSNNNSNGNNPDDDASLSSSSPRFFLRNQQVVEIGCGTGLVSIMASLLGAKSVWATDGNPAAVALTASNFKRNAIPFKKNINPVVSSPSSSSDSNNNNSYQSEASSDNVVTNLQWGELQVPLEWMGQADIVLGSDLTYNSGSWRDLAETMESLLTRKGYVLYLSLGHAGFNVRGEMDGFLSVAKQVGLTVKSTSPLPFSLPSSVSSLDALLQSTILPSEQAILSVTGGAQVVVLGRP